MNSLPPLSVVLPAYNEEGSIPHTLEDIKNTLASAPQWEIIVVNDGSTDRTADVVNEWHARFPNIRLESHAKNKGYGEALRTGFNVARLEWILLMDSDGQFSMKSLEKLLPSISRADMVAGYRENRADGAARALFTWGYMRLVNLFFGLGMHDVGCGFKLFKSAAWKQVQPIEAKDHKMFSVEWMAKTKRAGLKMVEVAVPHHPRKAGQPTGARGDVVWAMLKEWLALKRRLN